jgi:transcriptional regulator with XRE-family HTH domain
MREFAARDIGERIALARRQAGAMTQEQLAELLNVSTRSVQDYEAGATIPWKHFQRLEIIFEKPLGWFLHGDDGGPATEDLQAQILQELAELRALVQKLLERGNDSPAGGSP